MEPGPGGWKVAPLLLVGLAACGGAETPDDTGGARTPTLSGVGAHPDDELMAAPLVAAPCLDEGCACTLAVATRGESGSCGLPGGCEPDLATVRSGELATSAAALGAEVVQWDLGDTGGREPEEG